MVIIPKKERGMQTLTLQVRDDFVEKFYTVLELFPKSAVKIKEQQDTKKYLSSQKYKKDKTETQEALNAVADSKVKLDSFDSVVDKQIEKWQSKCK